MTCTCPCIYCSMGNHWMCSDCKKPKLQCHYCFRTVHQDADGTWRHDVTNRAYCVITVPVQPRSA